MEIHIERLQERLGYTFGDTTLLVQALTHRSFGHEHHSALPFALRDNERLEFLGDAILDVVISDLLLESFPNSNEGQLTKMRAGIVNEKTLNLVARGIRLHDCVHLGKGELQTGGVDKPSILCGTFEALIAAVYLDGGFEAVYPMVRNLFSGFFDASSEEIVFYDHKTQLQELIQARWKLTPTYHIRGTRGPEHAKTFEVEVRIRHEVIATATGNSKKEAEQNAARTAIQLVNL